MAGATQTDTLDICICTFRRPALNQTMRSLASVRIPPGYKVGVIVADNDDIASAEGLVTHLARELNLPVRYIHCPARNISIARNACLDASRARFVAFIDDDETATVEWLTRLVDEAEARGADVVLGPVKAGYATDAPDWMRSGDFHSTFPVWVGGEIRTGYTCNVLIRMDAASVRGRRFSLDRGQTGGEDTEFFDQVYRDGGKIAYAGEAWIEEVVPAQRATFGWLSRRRYRVGQTHGRLLAGKMSGIALLRELAVASAKVTYCFVAAGLSVLWPVSRNRNTLRGIMHVGVLSGLIGVQELRQYGGPTEGKYGGPAKAKGRKHAA